jgi:hypothetical protein
MKKFFITHFILFYIYYIYHIINFNFKDIFYFPKLFYRSLASFTRGLLNSSSDILTPQDFDIEGKIE